MSDRISPPAPATHSEAWQLLPWYVNGTLTSSERHAVELHLEACGECRDELVACRRTAEWVTADVVTAPSPHPARLQQLLQRLEATPPGGASEAPAEAPGGHRLAAALGDLSPLGRMVIAAQLAAILLLGGLLAADLRPQAVAGYRMLADPPATVESTTGERLRVVFSPELSERQLRQTLLTVDATIVDGPSPLGVYTLGLPSGAAAEPLEVVLEWLRDQEGVEFAERATH